MENRPMPQKHMGGAMESLRDEKVNKIVCVS